MERNEIHFALPPSFQIHRANSHHEALTVGSVVLRDEKRKQKKKKNKYAARNSLLFVRQPIIQSY